MYNFCRLLCNVYIYMFVCIVACSFYISGIQKSKGIGVDEEDALEAEKKAEQERLRVLGLERARREEEDRVRR